MDLGKIIKELTEDKAKIEAAIAMLEDLQQNTVEVPPVLQRKRKSRKPMPPEERRNVSDRMKHYWARFREERKLAPSV
ncbi:MAG TPA: hypothetical protein VML19_01660 [Verrucomicrobiae bacterium]|nr:hypothetical protein [Verrucomicrobiae bacterium]